MSGAAFLDGLLWAEVVDPRPTTPGQDLHLVSGLQTMPWRESVRAKIGTQVLEAQDLPAGWTITVVAPDLTGSGVVVDPVTAQIRLEALAAPPRVLSFVVTAQLVDPDATPVGPPLHRRVHCHDTVTAVWLTPSRLGVPRGGSTPRLTLLARFGDGSIGDVTNWVTPIPGSSVPSWYVHAPVAPGESREPALSWDPVSLNPDDDAPSVFVDAGYLWAGSLDHGTRICATLTRPTGPVLGGDADVTPTSGWPAATPVRFVEGSRPPPDGLGSRANVLFLGDGFRDRVEFEHLVDDIVRILCRDEYLVPFHLLAEEISWWSAFAPSADEGITRLRPVDRYPDLPFVRSADSPAPPPGPLVDSGDPGSRAAGSGLILLDENDTVFGTCYGFHPQAQGGEPDRSMGLYPRRRTEDDVDTFLGTLTGVADADVRWRSGGTDDRFVVVLCRISGMFGTNSRRRAGGNLILVGTGGPLLAITEVGQGWAANSFRLPPPNTMALARTVAHELGHSLWLGDEYAVLAQEAPDPDPVRAFANLQPRVDLEDADHRLDAHRISWDWPRLRHACLLTTSAAIEGDRVTVTLDPVQAVGLAVGDTVRLRTRPLVTASTSPLLVISSMVVEPASEVLSVQRVVLEPAAGQPVPAGPFVAGSLLMVPLRDGDGNEVSLVAPEVVDHIGRHSNPLNAAAADPDDRPCILTAKNVDVVPATNPPPGLPTGVLTQHVVGLWEGGAQYTCGVYHPTGACLMCSTSMAAEHSEAHPRFCAVCRYVLIDELAPNLHPVVDAQYDGWPVGVR